MDPHSDPKMRDKKVLPMSNSLLNFPLFLFLLLIGLPFWLLILLPLTIASQLLTGIWKKVAPVHRRKDKRQENPKELIENISKKSSDANRKYDLVMFGATGFTGRLACLYLAKQYGASFRWAIAGRRKDALEKIRLELTAINKDLSVLPIIIADSGNFESLDAMTSEAKVVITTAGMHCRNVKYDELFCGMVGPFDRYGGSLVKSCAMHGTHYCDITGEVDWVREMIDQYDDVAKASGARLVSFCGHDCVPWDLAVMECAKMLRKRGDTIKEVRIFDELNSLPSGGTLETVFHTLSNRVKYNSLLGFDPLLKNPNGEKSTNKIIVQNQLLLGYRSEYSSWVGPFIMADVMSNCVRRSNALNNYSSKLIYNEAYVYPNFTAGFIQFFGLIFFGTALVFPPLQWFLRKFVLPPPGQGPSEDFMDQGFLKLVVFADGMKGGKAQASFYFPTDPGYRDTARMLVESGLVLALESDKIKVGGGYYTPAACQGELLIQRLLNTGSSFCVE